MPNNGLEFVDRDLIVSYQASHEMQDFRIHMETGIAIQMNSARIALRSIFDAINEGAASGVEFAPYESSAEEVDFVFGEKRTSWGPNYDFTLRVRAVSHLFMRNIVETMRIAGWGNPILKMHLIGSLPIRTSATSATEADVRKWIHDPQAYPGAWSELGFPVKLDDSTGKRVTVEVEFRDRIDAKVQEQIELILIEWTNAIQYYLDDRGNTVSIDDISKTIPNFAKRKRTLVASYDEIRHAREPSRAALVNMLCRFHHKVAPIASVRIAM